MSGPDHFRPYDRLGSHLFGADGRIGISFAVWAPNAEAVSVIGDFNAWVPGAHPLRPRERSGIWEGFIAGLAEGTLCKYHILSRHDGYRVDKADPFGFYHEMYAFGQSFVLPLSHVKWSTAKDRS